jgi:hypothetical protein
MKRISSALVMLSMLGMLCGNAAAASELSAVEIMEKNFFASKLPTLKTESHMVLVNDKGQQRERRSVNQIKLQPNGIDSKFLVKFTSPADINGTAFLQVEHSDGEDDLWIYLPALKKSRRLVANNKKDSFVGSDFSYGDVLLPKINLYQHSLTGSEVIEGHDCFIIESIPADDTVKANSGYSKKITWVRKDNYLESKVEYFDISGRPLKTQLARDHKLIDPAANRWIPLYREMANHRTGHKTIFRFEKIETGLEMPDSLFSTRYLERE